MTYINTVTRFFDYGILAVIAVTLSGCIIPAGMIREAGNASKDIGIGVGIAQTGSAINNLAKSKIKKEETAQLQVEANTDLSILAEKAISEVKDEKTKAGLIDKVINAHTSRIAQENETKRAQGYSNAYLAGSLGLLVGFILAIILSNISSALSRVSIKYKPL